MSLSVQLLATALRSIVAGVCALGIWNSLNMARADFLFRQDTAQSVRSAIGLEPDAAPYYMRLAQLDENHGPELLEAALRLNRYNARAAIELGLRYEAQGDYNRAEKLLLQAFAVDRTYLPRWSLANFYLRRNNIPAFWIWAHRSAEMPSDDVGALFALCWRVSPDPERITAMVLNDDPQLNAQYLRFLLENDRTRAAAGTALRLVRFGKPETDRSLVFTVVDRLITAGEPIAALALWQELVHQGWVVADATIPNNADFARDPLPIGFDWAVASYSGLRSILGPSGLETEFLGVQPEDCSIAEQTLVLTPGNYTAKYSYFTADILPATGIRWQIIDAESGAVIANSPDLSSNALTHSAFEFSVAPGSSLLRLRLSYHRAPGTTRIEGTLVVQSIQIEARKLA